MLQITIPATEKWDEIKETFISTKEQTLELEHSLASLSKWESRWHKAFLSRQDKTFEETIDYIKCMTITRDINPNVYYNLTNENINQINKYIDEPMTATVISETNMGGTSREPITAEIIYYWMVSLNIPFECEKWHLNRLITFIKVCSIKNSPPKKMSKRSILRQNAALNEARKKQLNTKG